MEHASYRDDNAGGCWSWFILLVVIISILVGIVGVGVTGLGLVIGSVAVVGIGAALLTVSALAVTAGINNRRGPDEQPDLPEEGERPSDGSRPRGSSFNARSTDRCPHCDAAQPAALTVSEQWKYCPACGDSWRPNDATATSSDDQLDLFASFQFTPAGSEPPAESEPPPPELNEPAETAAESDSEQPASAEMTTTEASPDRAAIESNESPDGAQPHQDTEGDDPETEPPGPETTASDLPESEDVQPSFWSQRLFPLIADNWLYLLGSILVLGSGAYAIAYTWQTLSTVARHLMVTGLLTGGAASFAGVGRWLESRFETAKGADVFWLIGAGLVIAAAISAGLAYPFSVPLGAGLTAAVALVGPLIVSQLHPLPARADVELPFVTWMSPGLLAVLSIASQDAILGSVTSALPIAAGGIVVIGALLIPPPAASRFVDESRELAGDYSATLHWMTTAAWPFVVALCTIGLAGLRLSEMTAADTLATVAPGMSLLAWGAVELTRDGNAIPEHRSTVALVASAIAAATAGAALWAPFSLLAASIPAAIAHIRARAAHPATEYGAVLMLAAASYASFLLAAPHLEVPLEATSLGGQVLFATAPLSLVLAAVARQVNDETSRRIAVSTGLMPVVPLAVALFALTNAQVTWLELSGCLLHGAATYTLAILRDEPLLIYLSAALGVCAALFVPSVTGLPEPTSAAFVAAVAGAAIGGAMFVEAAERAPNADRALTESGILITIAAPFVLWTSPVVPDVIAGASVGPTAWSTVAALGSFCIVSLAVFWVARRTARQVLVWFALLVFGTSAALGFSLARALIGFESSGAGRLIVTGVVAVAFTEITLRFRSLVRTPDERTSIFGFDPPEDDAPDTFATPLRVLAHVAMTGAVILPLLSGSPIWAGVVLSALGGVAALRVCAIKPDARLAGILAPLAIVAWVPQTVAATLAQPLPLQVAVAALTAGAIWEAGKWLMSSRRPLLTSLHATGLRVHESGQSETDDLEQIPLSMRTLWQSTLIFSGLLLAVLAVAAMVTNAPGSLSAWNYLGLFGVVVLAGSDLIVRPGRAASLFIVFASALGFYRGYEATATESATFAPIWYAAGVALFTLIWWVLDTADSAPRPDLFRRWTGTFGFLGAFLFAAFTGFQTTTTAPGHSGLIPHSTILAAAVIVSMSAIALYSRCRNITTGILAAGAPLVAALTAAHLCWALDPITWIHLTPFVSIIAIGIGFSLQHFFPPGWPGISLERGELIEDTPPGIPAIDQLIPKTKRDVPIGFPRSHRTAWRYLFNILAVGIGAWALVETVSLVIEPLEILGTEPGFHLTLLSSGLAAASVAIPGLIDGEPRLPETIAAIGGALGVGAATTGLFEFDIVMTASAASAILLALERALWRRRDAGTRALQLLNTASWGIVVVAIGALAENALQTPAAFALPAVAPLAAIAIRSADRFDRATARLLILWSIVAFPIFSCTLLGATPTGITVGALAIPIVWSLVAELARRLVRARPDDQGENEVPNIASVLADQACSGAALSTLLVLIGGAGWIVLALIYPTFSPAISLGLLAGSALLAVAFLQFLQFPAHLTRLNLAVALTLGAVAATLPFAGLFRLQVLYVALGFIVVATAGVGRIGPFPRPEDGMAWIPLSAHIDDRARPPLQPIHLWLPMLLWGSAAGLGLAFTPQLGTLAIGSAAMLTVASFVAPRPGESSDYDWLRELTQAAGIVILVGAIGQSYWARPIFFSTGLLATGVSAASLWLAARSEFGFFVELITASALALCLMALGTSQPTPMSEWITLSGFGLVATCWLLRLLRDDIEIDGYLAAFAFAAGYVFLRLRIGLVPAAADPWVAQGAGLLILVLESFARSDGSDKLRRVTLVLTLVLPAVGWIVSLISQPGIQPGVLAGGGSLYLLAGWQLKARGLFIPALVIFNAEVVLAWWRAGVVEPVVYALPVGLTLIAFARIYGEQLGQSGRNWLRGLGCVIVYATSSYHLFAFEGLQPVLITAGLAIAGVVAGLVLRVRSYLYFGTLALLFDLAVNLFRIGTQDTLTGTAILFVLGVLMLAAGVTYNVRREAIRTRLDQLRRTLRDWE